MNIIDSSAMKMSSAIASTSGTNDNDSNRKRDKTRIVKDFIQEQKENIGLNRTTATAMALALLACFFALLSCVLAFLGIILLLSCPIWFPILILTRQWWVPFLVWSSPVLISVIVLLFVLAIATFILFVSVLFFFIWPEEWLPSKDESTVVAYFLYYRDRATINLAKLQAKSLMYAAGVGPATEVIFFFYGKYFEALIVKLQQVDWKEIRSRVKRGRILDIPRVLYDIIRGLLR